MISSDINGECSDVDECSDGSNACDSNASCTNTEGNFHLKLNLGKKSISLEV